MKHTFDLFNGGIETIALEKCEKDRICFQAYKRGDEVIRVDTLCPNLINESGQLCCKHDLVKSQDHEQYEMVVAAAARQTNACNPAELARLLANGLISLMSCTEDMDISWCAFAACQLANGQDIYTLTSKHHSADIAVSLIINPRSVITLRKVIEHLLFEKNRRGIHQSLWRISI